MSTQLVNGDTMAALPAVDLEGNAVDITASMAGHWGVVQFYRGHW